MRCDRNDGADETATAMPTPTSPSPSQWRAALGRGVSGWFSGGKTHTRPFGQNVRAQVTAHFGRGQTRAGLGADAAERSVYQHVSTALVLFKLIMQF